MQWIQEFRQLLPPIDLFAQATKRATSWREKERERERETGLRGFPDVEG